ncbi:MAG: class I SAM-dependent methyltransferase [Solirubrobacteraceae bacterium]
MADLLAKETSDRSSLFEFAVLREQGQIATADCELQQRGLLETRPEVGIARRMVRRLLRRPDPELVLKTWDVLRSVEAFAARLEPTDPILDMGCFACDMLPALKRFGYRNLYGIDLNPAISQMPYADAIDYKVGDLLSTPWPDSHFAGISAISVIEHGVPDEELCREVSRLLRPGGVFLFTTDYWPQKIVTSERIFDLDWRIFDTKEIEALVAVAHSHDLHVASDPDSAIRDVASPAIHFSDKDYTFLYGAFVKG